MLVKHIEVSCVSWKVEEHRRYAYAWGVTVYSPRGEYIATLRGLASTEYDAYRALTDAITATENRIDFYGVDPQA